MSTFLIIFIILFIVVFLKFLIGLLGLTFNKKFTYVAGIKKILKYSPTTQLKLENHIVDLAETVIDYSRNNNYDFNNEVELLKSVTIRCIMYVSKDDLNKIPQNLLSNKFEAISIATHFLERNNII